MSEMFVQAMGTITVIEPLYEAGVPAKAYVKFALRINPVDRNGPRESVVVNVQAAGALAEDVAAKLDVGDRVQVNGRWGSRGSWVGVFASSVGLDLRAMDEPVESERVLRVADGT